MPPFAWGVSDPAGTMDEACQLNDVITAKTITGYTISVKVLAMVEPGGGAEKVLHIARWTVEQLENSGTLTVSLGSALHSTRWYQKITGAFRG